MSNKTEKNLVVPDTFGKRLRKCRKDKQLSQTELATMLGYKHNGPVSTMETDKTDPDLQTLQKLSECLGVDLHWLITGQTTPHTIHFAAALEPYILEFLRELNGQILRIENQIVRLKMGQQLRGEDNQAQIKAQTTARDRLKEQYDRIVGTMQNAGRL